MAAFMPRLMSGSCPTCVRSPVFAFVSVTSDAPAAKLVSAPAKARTAAPCVQSTVQSANVTATGAAVSAAPAQSAGCAPAEPGDSASAANAIVAAHTERTRRWAMRSSPCPGGALPRRPPDVIVTPMPAAPHRLVGVADQNVVGAVERPGVEQAERGGRRRCERGRAVAEDDRSHDQMQLVDEPGGEQVVPERPAAEDDDVAAGPALELGDPLVGVGAADDAGCVAPRVGLVGREAVRYDDLLDRVLQPRDLTVGRRVEVLHRDAELLRGGLGIVGDAGVI